MWTEKGKGGGGTGNLRLQHSSKKVLVKPVGVLKPTWPTRKILHPTGMRLQWEPAFHSWGGAQGLSVVLVSMQRQLQRGTNWAISQLRSSCRCEQLMVMDTALLKFSNFKSYLPFPPSIYPNAHLPFPPLLLSFKKSYSFSSPKLISPCIPANRSSDLLRDIIPLIVSFLFLSSGSYLSSSMQTCSRFSNLKTKNFLY